MNLHFNQEQEPTLSTMTVRLVAIFFVSFLIFYCVSLSASTGYESSSPKARIKGVNSIERDTLKSKKLEKVVSELKRLGRGSESQVPRPSATNPSYCLSKIPSLIEEQINKLPRSRVALSFRGYKKNGEMIDMFERNENDYMVPASNNKLLTCAAAYLDLTPDYKFKTFLTEISNPAQNLGTKDASPNLCLTLTGDPELSVSDLQTLIMKAKQFSSSLFLDVESFFGVESQDIYPTWEISDLAYDYGAQPIAASISRLNRTEGVTNTFLIEINPGRNVGDKMEVKVLEPPGLPAEFWSNALPVHFQSTTGSPDSPSSLSVQAVFGHFGVTIKGSLPVGGKPQRIVVPHSNPRLFSQILISYLAREANMSVNQSTCFNPSDKVIYQHESRPLHMLMDHTLKVSDNTYAELIYRQLGAKYMKTKYGRAETIAKEKVKSIVSSLPNMKADSFVQADGSGLSRWNLVTSDALTTLMKNMQDKYPNFINLLPEAGKSGTLSTRFTKYPGILKAKTGTLTYAISLSGIIYSSYFDHIAFSAMINLATNSAAETRNIMDEICIMMAFTDPSC